ncbi:MAG: hypothetical protein ABSH41_11325, partial [Syntrophobacteraceae bacterium]
RPGDESEMSVAFQMIEAMAADIAFRPYLPDCIRSREDAFRKAFPERFLSLVSALGDPDSFSKTTPSGGGTN